MQRGCGIVARHFRAILITHLLRPSLKVLCPDWYCSDTPQHRGVLETWTVFYRDIIRIDAEDRPVGGCYYVRSHVEASGRAAVPVVIFFRPEQITVIVVLFVTLRGAEGLSDEQ